jgi:uncharacterized phage protein gp47/JayE
MPVLCGLTEKGFKAKDFQAIKDDLEADLRLHVDPTMHFGAGSVAGIITAIVSNQARQVWEVAHGLYHSLQPHTACGVALDVLCSLTGIYRKKGAYSKAKAELTLKPKVTVVKDSRIKTVGGNFFKLVEDVKNTSTVETRIDADFIAEEYGPIYAHKDTEAKIMTPIEGWSKAVFFDTYEPGCLAETDEQLRKRRFSELRANGASTTEAIKQRLLQISHVEAVHIKEHERGFEAIVKGGTDEDIAKTIWQCKPIGISTIGQVELTVTDSIKEPRAIRFSRPEIIHLSLFLDIKVKRLLEQDDLDAIKNSFAEFGSKNFKLGTEVYPARLYSVAFSQPEILDVTSLLLLERLTGRSPIADIKPHQIASLGFSDIEIKQTVEVHS